MGDGVPRCQSGPLSSRPREGEGGERPGDSESGQCLLTGESLGRAGGSTQIILQYKWRVFLFNALSIADMQSIVQYDFKSG